MSSQVKKSTISVGALAVTWSSTEYKGKGMRVQCPMVVMSWIKYVHMRLFNSNMWSKNLWIVSNDSEMSLPNELHKLNHLVNWATYLAKLKSSKH